MPYDDGGIIAGHDENTRNNSVEHRSSPCTGLRLQIDTLIVDFHVFQIGVLLRTEMSDDAVTPRKGSRQFSSVLRKIARQLFLVFRHQISRRSSRFLRRIFLLRGSCRSRFTRLLFYNLLYPSSQSIGLLLLLFEFLFQGTLFFPKPGYQRALFPLLANELF